MPMPHLKHIPPPSDERAKIMANPRNDAEESEATATVWSMARAIREARRMYFHDDTFRRSLENCNTVKTGWSHVSKIEERIICGRTRTLRGDD